MTAVRRAPPPLTLLALLSACGAGDSAGESGGRGAQEPGGRPNVVVITIDTLRFDHLGFGGNPRETAPFLRELAARGTVFDRAFSTSSWTAPATASLFTGLYPTRHGVVLGFFAQFRQLDAEQESETLELRQLPPHRPTLPELFREAGYGTFGLATNLNIGSELGFDRGFDRFEKLDERPATEVLDRLIEWKPEIAAAEPYFLYLHFNDVHGPYEEHAPWFEPSTDSRVRAISAYQSEISFLDEVLRRIHDELSIDEHTLLVVVSDHGEEFMEHGQWEHQFKLFRELTQVLFLVHGPGLGVPAQRIEASVALVDVLPTVAELAGLSNGPACNGRSLAPLLREDDPDQDFLDDLEERPVFLHRYSRLRGIEEEIWAVIKGKWKLYEHLDQRWLFNLEQDRLDLRPIPPEKRPRVTAELAPLLEEFKARGTDVHEARSVIQLDPALRERLEALGYVADEDE